MNIIIIKIELIDQNRSMESQQLPTEEEVRSVARQGEDAVITELSRFTSETTLRDGVALVVVARK